MDGTAETQVERFEAEEHSFDEYTAVSFLILHFRYDFYSTHSNKKGTEEQRIAGA